MLVTHPLLFLSHRAVDKRIIEALKREADKAGARAAEEEERATLMKAQAALDKKAEALKEAKRAKLRALRQAREERKRKEAAAAAKKKRKESSSSSSGKRRKDGSSSSSSSAAAAASASSATSRNIRAVPAERLPELAVMLQSAGHMGVERLVKEFLAKYPGPSRRQAVAQISVIASKVIPSSGDKRGVWQLKPDYATLASPVRDVALTTAKTVWARTIRSTEESTGKPASSSSRHKRPRDSTGDDGDDEDDDEESAPIVSGKGGGAGAGSRSTNGSSSSHSKRQRKSGDKKSSGGGSTGPKFVMPQSMLQLLAATLEASGKLGKEKVVEKFSQRCQGPSKRQLSMCISEIAEKTKLLVSMGCGPCACWL